jgi:hypothetical protein
VSFDPRNDRSHRLQRWLASVVVGVLASGVLGSGITAAVHQHREQVQKQRIAAQKRAVEAYVAAVKPLAIRVYDAVQPIQDAIDGFADLKPGVTQARDDVVLHGGAIGELGVVRESLAGLKVPRDRRTESQTLLTALAGLSTSVKKLHDVVPSLRSNGGWTTEYGTAEDTFTLAEQQWGIALAALQPVFNIPSPLASRGYSFGRQVPTLGGFILGSDLACGRAEHELNRLRHPKPANPFTTLPAEAKVLRRAVAALRKVPLPAARQAMQHRLDVELRGTLSLATSYERLAAAYRRHDVAGLDAALELWDEQRAALRRVDSTYKAVGVSICTAFFAVDDGKPAKKSFSA